MDVSECLHSSHRCCCREHINTEVTGTETSCRLHSNSSIHHGQHTFDDDFYEGHYHQLVKDREEMEHKYERERREREAAEEKFKREMEERTIHEEKFLDLNRSLERYEEDLNLLRNENVFFKNQFDSLRSAINSRECSYNADNTNLFPDPEVFFNSSLELTESANSDSYKQEVAVLASENQLFEQLIDIINKQSHEKSSLDESISEKYIVENNWRTDQEMTRFQDENSTLKSRVRELERGRRELESQLEQVTLDLQENNRRSSKEVSRLEEDIHSKTIFCEDMERQLLQIRCEYHEEVQKCELRIEAEVLMKTQFQEEMNALEHTVQILETERIEMVSKLEELYISENDIILARNELECRFSNEINDLQTRLENEIRTKVEISQEMTVLMNEFIELRNKSKEMEEMYVGEIQALRYNLGAVMGDGVALQSNVSSGVHPTQANTFTSNQQPTAIGSVPQAGNDVQGQLQHEIQKREVLEKENKELLYKMKNILSNPDQIASSERMTQQISEISDSSYPTKKIRTLENKVADLTEECESLERCAKKRKETENKNRELLDEIDELFSERNGMLRKQKTLVSDVDKSSSSLQDVADRNRRLMSEIDSTSRTIRDMEDSFRQERNSLLRSFDREKTLEVSDVMRKKEDVENRLNDKIRENRKLEDRMKDLENEIRGLKHHQQRPQNNERNINGRSGGESVESNAGYSTENVVQERNNDYLKALEEQKKQLRDEFDRERESLRRCFEEEKRDLSNRLNGISDKSHVMNASDGLQVANQGSFNGHDSRYSQIGQPGQPVTHGTSGIYSSTQQPNATHNVTPSQSMVAQPQNPNTQQFNPLPHQQSPTNVPFFAPQHLPYPQPQNMVSPNNQSMAYQTGMAGNNQESQHNGNINRLQQEVQRLNTEKQSMEQRMEDLERRVGHGAANMNVRHDTTLAGYSGGFDGDRNHSTHSQIDDTYRTLSDNDQYSPIDTGKRKVQFNGKQTSVDDSNDFGNIDSMLQVTMKKLVEEHRQHSDELQRQSKLQKDSFEKEKRLMQKEQEKLISDIKCLKKELHIFRHERESMREKVRRERIDSQRREAGTRDEITTVRREYDIQLKQEINKSTRIIEELRRNTSISESRVKELETKFRKEITLIEKRCSQEKINLEVKLRETENQVTSRLELHYQTKFNTEKERYEKTLKDLRKEIVCLQEQRKEIQITLSKDLSSNAKVSRNDTNGTVSIQNRDQYRYLQREFENRFAKEKRSLEDTIQDMRRELDKLEREKSDTKSSYEEEKKQMEEQYEREKRRIEERYRSERDDLKRSLDMLQINNVKMIAMDELPHHHNNSSLSTGNNPFMVIEKKNSSLESRNHNLEHDVRYLKGKLRDLESRQTKLFTSKNDKSSSLGDRKVRFEVIDNVNNNLKRSRSSTDLRNSAGLHSNSVGMATNAFSSVRRQGSSALASQYDHGGMANNMSTSRVLSLEGSQSLGASRSSNGGYDSGFSVNHIPSTGILNGGVRLAGGGGGSGLTLSGRGTSLDSSRLYRNVGLMGGSSGSNSALLFGNGMGMSSGSLSGNGMAVRSGGLSGNGMGMSLGSLSGNGMGMRSGDLSGNGMGMSLSGLSGNGMGMSLGGLSGNRMAVRSGGLSGNGMGMSLSGNGVGISSGILSGNGMGMSSVGLSGNGLGMSLGGLSGYGMGMSSGSLSGNGMGMSSGGLSGDGMGMVSGGVSGNGMKMSSGGVSGNGMGMSSGGLSGDGMGMVSGGVSGNGMEMSSGGVSGNGMGMSSGGLSGNGMEMSSGGLSGDGMGMISGGVSGNGMGMSSGGVSGNGMGMSSGGLSGNGMGMSSGGLCGNGMGMSSGGLSGNGMAISSSSLSDIGANSGSLSGMGSSQMSGQTLSGQTLNSFGGVSESLESAL